MHVFYVLAVSEQYGYQVMKQTCDSVFMIYFRTTRPALLYVGSIAVLAVYSILYGFTAKEACWLGGVTSASVFIFGKNCQLIGLISLSNFSQLGQQLPLC